MAKTSEISNKTFFRRSFRGYKKKDVDEYIARTEQEFQIKEEDHQTRIALLVQENEHAAQMIKALQEEQGRLHDDNVEYKRQLKESKSTIQTLYDRLDILGSETDRLQNSLNEFRKNAIHNEPSAEEWKQRALTAEETIRKMAEAELKANEERENAQHIRLPFGKKAYLDLSLHKDDKSV